MPISLITFYNCCRLCCNKFSFFLVTRFIVFSLPDCCQTAKVTIFQKFFNLVGVFIHHIPLFQIISKLHQMTMGVITWRLILNIYLTHARKLTLLNAFTDYLLCWGRSKVYSFPQGWSTFMQILVVSLYVNKLLIKFQEKTFTLGIQ